MSRAFVKEDVDPPERSTRARSSSGLPPGATNYMTASGARHIQSEIDTLPDAEAEQLQSLLRGATVVEPSRDPKSVSFGAIVTVKDERAETHTFHIVGVDELDFTPNAVSWVSETGKLLLAAELGDRVTLPGIGTATITQVEYPS